VGKGNNDTTSDAKDKLGGVNGEGFNSADDGRIKYHAGKAINCVKTTGLRRRRQQGQVGWARRAVLLAV
jgi:hypothetical protein